MVSKLLFRLDGYLVYLILAVLFSISLVIFINIHCPLLEIF